MGFLWPLLATLEASGTTFQFKSPLADGGWACGSSNSGVVLEVCQALCQAHVYRGQCGVGLRHIWSWTQPGERKEPCGANPNQAVMGRGGVVGK